MTKQKTALSPEAQKIQGNLRLWRKARKLTLSALAEQTGYGLSTLSSWENGARAVDVDDLRRLAAIYGVHPAALLFSPKDAGPKVSVMQKAASIAEKLPAEDAETWLKMGELSLRGSEKE